MSDDRGPLTGSGDEPPVPDAPTGPPTAPRVQASPAAEVPAPSNEPPPEAVEAVAQPDTGPPPLEESAVPAADPPEEPPTAPSTTPTAAPASPHLPQPAIVVPVATVPTVIAIPDLPSDTPVFVMAETVSASVVAAAAPALPVAASAWDAPAVAQAVAPPVAPVAARPALEPEPEPAPIAAPAPPPAIAPPPVPPPILAVPVTPPAEVLPPPVHVPARSLWPRRLRRVVLILVGLGFGYAALVLGLIVAYRWIDPPRSALMITTRLSGQNVIYAPVPITSISSYLQRAVVTSEDARFCYHPGVDWAALYEAMNESRGGSTITMQVAKNLFLWSSRSYIRKAIEIPVALTIDAVWPKRRILEVYLNIAEWGPGIFGAEAASYYHFDKPASRLTAQEAALLAASLPNPIARDAGEPGRITALLASRLRGRMAHSDAFVRCLGLRPIPRAEPRPPARPATKPAARPQSEQRPAAKAGPELKPWQTTTEPAFNPWQN